MNLAEATNATTTATITSGMTARPSDASSREASKTEVSGSLSMTTDMAPMPMATPSNKWQPGQVDRATPPGRAEEQGREGRAAAEAAQRHAVGESLADEEQQERSDAVGGAVGDERAEGGLAGEQHLGGALAGGFGERDGQPAIARPTTGVSSTIRRSTSGRRNSASHRMAEPTGTANTPIASAHKNSPPVGAPAWGRPGIASENVPSPVQASRPMKIREPTPAASRPGTRTTPSTGRPGRRPP